MSKGIFKADILFLDSEMVAGIVTVDYDQCPTVTSQLLIKIHDQGANTRYKI